MTKTETIDILERFNRWRQGIEPEPIMPPSLVTKSIESAIEYLKEPNL